MWYFVVWWMGANVFEKPVVSIFCPGCQGSRFPCRGVTCKIWGCHSFVAEDSGCLGCYTVLLSVLFLMFWRHCDNLKHQELLSQWHSVTSQRTTQHCINKDCNPNIHCYESLISQCCDVFSDKLHKGRYGKGTNIWGFRSSGMWHFVGGCVVHDILKDWSDFTLEDKGTMVLPYFWNLLSNAKCHILEYLNPYQHCCENPKSSSQPVSSQPTKLIFDSV